MLDGVTIDIDGKERNLVFTFPAMILFEEITGRNTLQENLLVNFSSRDMCAFLYACFKQEEPEIKFEEVGKMITRDNVKEILDKCIESYKKSQPDPTDKKQAKKKTGNR